MCFGRAGVSAFFGACSAGPAVQRHEDHSPKITLPPIERSCRRIARSAIVRDNSSVLRSHHLQPARVPAQRSAACGWEGVREAARLALHACLQDGTRSRRARRRPQERCEPLLQGRFVPTRAGYRPKVIVKPWTRQRANTFAASRRGRFTNWTTYSSDLFRELGWLSVFGELNGCVPDSPWINQPIRRALARRPRARPLGAELGLHACRSEGGLPGAGIEENQAAGKVHCAGEMFCFHRLPDEVPGESWNFHRAGDLRFMPFCGAWPRRSLPGLRRTGRAWRARG